MNKEQIKEMILTDLIDGELDESKRQEIMVLINQDEELKVFYNKVIEMKTLPFDQAHQLSVPADAWQNIKERIEGADSIEKEHLHIWDIIQSFFFNRRWVMASGFAVVFICIGLAFQILQPVSLTQKTVSSEEQVEYLMLLTQDTSIIEYDYDNISDKIEHYFL